MEILRYTKALLSPFWSNVWGPVLDLKAYEFPVEYPTFRHARTDVVALFIMREIKCFEYVECIKLKWTFPHYNEGFRK